MIPKQILLVNYLDRCLIQKWILSDANCRLLGSLFDTEADIISKLLGSLLDTEADIISKLLGSLLDAEVDVIRRKL